MARRAVGCRHFHSLGLETWEGRVEAIILCPHFYAPSPSHRLASFAPILQKNQQNQWLILHSETKIIQHPILWYQVHLTRKPASIWEIFIVVEVEGQIKSDGKKSGIKKTCVLTKVGHRPTDKWILSLDGVWSCLKNSWNPFFLGITWQDSYAWNFATENWKKYTLIKPQEILCCFNTDKFYITNNFDYFSSYML